jgi:hypothetical protein
MTTDVQGLPEEYVRLRNEFKDSTGDSVSYWRITLDTYVRSLIERQSAELEACREALNLELEIARERKYPQPFRVSHVYVTRGDVRYLLPIIRQWNEWPDIAIEVGYIDAALAATDEVQKDCPVCFVPWGACEHTNPPKAPHG